MSDRTEEIEQLVKLRDDADEVLTEIKAQGQVGGAINWADLSCVEARSILNDQGHTYLEVSIEEASPDATALRLAISTGLERKGWKNVTVITEW